MTRFAKKLLSLLIIIVLIGVGIYSFFNKNAPTEDIQTAVVSSPQDTAPISGCYVATLGNDVYTFTIDSDSNGSVNGTLAFNNYEKDSSSGTFTGTRTGDILLGTYSFDSEGMYSLRQVIFKKIGDTLVEGFGAVKVVDNKEVFEDTSTVTYDPKSTFIKSDACILHFTDTNKTLMFDYNALFPLFTGSKTPTTDWKLDAKDKGILFARVTIPRGYMSKTNFSDAKFTIGRSTTTAGIKSCMTSGTKANIGGYPFAKVTTNEAGAGNFYETTRYQGIVDGDCYAIEYTIHSTNIGNYSPGQGIKEFDKAKIQSELEKIITSIKFIVNSN